MTKRVSGGRQFSNKFLSFMSHVEKYIICLVRDAQQTECHVYVMINDHAKRYPINVGSGKPVLTKLICEN